MWIQNIVHEACPICGKETTLAVIEPHPTHPYIKLHTYRCVDCGAVKTTSVLLGPRVFLAKAEGEPSSIRHTT
jgi:uncharacterized Zn finger protein